MTHRRPAAFGALATAVLWVGGTGTAAAHGLGGRGDLPLPLSNFLWGAGLALGISFAALGLLWTEPRLTRVAAGRATPPAATAVVAWAELVGRTITLALFVTCVVAAFVGPDSAEANIAPVSLYVVFWVGLQVLSALVGDVWSALDPFDTLARLGESVGIVSAGSADGPVWAATATLSMFLWLELAYHTPSSPRAVGWFLVAYTLAMTAGVLTAGRGWLRRGDGFAVLFGLLGAMAPLERTDQGLRLRWPLSGLTRVRPSTSITVFVLVVLGSTTFDGVGRTDWWVSRWGDEVGWTRAGWSTLGLIGSVLAVAAVYYLAAWLGGRIVGQTPRAFADDYAHALVPIVLGYSVAHYFTLFVDQIQLFRILLSDPFGQGWNLFGTLYDSIDYTVVTPAQTAWVQAAAIVAGHVAGVVVAHDRAIERHRADRALRSQFAMLGAMITFSVAGLVLLLNA